MFKRRVQRPSASFRQEEVDKKVCVYDCRSTDTVVNEKWLETSGLDFNDFLLDLHKVTVANCTLG